MDTQINLLISIVIVNFNGGKYLEESILSVLDQDLEGVEIIVVDGGSTDQSINILEKYSDHFSWWVSEPDNGQSDALNKGFAGAKGEFYFWINSDDLLLPGSLFRTRQFIKKHNECKWFVANTVFFDSNNNIIRCSRGPKWSDYLFTDAPIAVYGPTSIFHHSIFKNSSRFDLSLFYSMDTDLWIQFQKMGIKFQRIPYYFWAFRVHSLSKTSNVFLGFVDFAYLKEKKFIHLKNNINHKNTQLIAQKLFKFFSGLYFLSWLDTFRYKGININFFKK